ncbi:MAG: phospholipase [Phormidesmis priestleyi]|uniref:Phospholipase n=1 Tax=Phormidesmis priestleyi TaxID=268141 RepID=A0A2W4XZG5_9CYAN|nr:MAG: phospholipase [Phormidesmis priestleyi]
MHIFFVMASSFSKVVSPLLLLSGLAALTYGSICWALYSYQTKLIFRPLPTLISTPAEAGIAYEDVWIPVSQINEANQVVTQTLHGWWLPNPSSDRTLLFCHGNYGNISYNLERIRFHHSLGFSVLAFDYRGYGLSDGPYPSEQATYADAEAAWHYLVNQRQISPDNITVMGHSIGGAIAIDLAIRQPSMAHLIVKSSFTTMRDAIVAKDIYRLFPIEQLLTEPFDSLSKVSQLQVPVLYIHGDQDVDVPFDLSQALYDASPEPKWIWFAAGATHNNISNIQGDAYREVVQNFCQDVRRSPRIVRDLSVV